MTERADEIKREHFFFTECFGQPIVVIPNGEMERLCEYVAALEAENAELKAENALWRERVQMRQELVEQYEKDIATLKRELAGEMEKY